MLSEIRAQEGQTVAIDTVVAVIASPAQAASASVKAASALAQTVPVFISHSSGDEPLAKGIANLLRASLRLRWDEIRCTSVEAHQLPGGTAHEDRLRHEIENAAAFVAVVSERSLRIKELLREASLWEDPDGRTRNAKSLRQTGISLRLIWAPIRITATSPSGRGRVPR